MKHCDELTDRQILVSLWHKVRGLEEADSRIEKKLDNHLNHMFTLTITLMGVVGSLIVALLVIILS